MKKLQKALALGLFFALAGLTCIEDFPISFTADSWRGAWLDNGGPLPVLAADTVAREALALRLEADFFKSSGPATNGSADNDTFFVAEKPLKKLVFIAVDGFGGGAAGSEITEKFRLRLDQRLGSRLGWAGVGEAIGWLNRPPASWENGFFVEFGLLDPPAAAAGPLRLAVRLEFETGPSADTTVFLPEIFLR